MLACRCDHDESKNMIMVETEWVLIIQGGGRKSLGHLIRHCRSQISESSKQGQMKLINTTISTKVEFYSIFLSFIVRILLSDIKSGSSFRVTVHASQVLKSAKTCIVYSPISKCWLHSLDMTLFERLGWYCGTKWRLKCPWVREKEKEKEEEKRYKTTCKNAHYSIQCKWLPCSQYTAVSSWSLLSSVDLFSAVYGSNRYGCRPVSYTHLRAHETA